jgi:hypothetical protein
MFSVSFSGKEIKPCAASETIDQGQKVFETIIARHGTWPPKIAMHNFKRLGGMLLAIGKRQSMKFC